MDKSKNHSITVLKDVIYAYTIATKAGINARGRKKENQDRALVLENMAQKDGLWMLGVLDGHGMFGHLVAQYVKDTLPNNILKV